MTAVAPAWPGDDENELERGEAARGDDPATAQPPSAQLDDDDETEGELAVDALGFESPRSTMSSALYEERFVAKYQTLEGTPEALRPLYNYSHSWEAALQLLPKFPVFHQRESKFAIVVKALFYFIMIFAGIGTSVWASSVVFPGIWIAHLSFVLFYLRVLSTYIATLRVLISTSHCSKLVHTVQLTIKEPHEIQWLSAYIEEQSRKMRLWTPIYLAAMGYVMVYNIVWRACEEEKLSQPMKIWILFFHILSYYAVSIFMLVTNAWPYLPLVVTTQFARVLRATMRDKKLSLEHFVERYRILQSITEHSTNLGGGLMGSLWLISAVLVLTCGVAALTTKDVDPMLIFMTVTGAIALVTTPIRAAKFNTLTSALLRTVGLLYGDACAELDGDELSAKTTEIARVLQYMQAAKVNFVAYGIRITPTVITSGLSTYFSILTVIFKTAVDSRGTGFTL